jgi:hypothetical protein
MLRTGLGGRSSLVVIQTRPSFIAALSWGCHQVTALPPFVDVSPLLASSPSSLTFACAGTRKLGTYVMSLSLSCGW